MRKRLIIAAFNSKKNLISIHCFIFIIIIITTKTTTITTTTTTRTI